MDDKFSNTAFKNDSCKKKLYVTPASNSGSYSFEIDLDDASLKIVSILGQTVFENQNLLGTNFSFDVSSLSN